HIHTLKHIDTQTHTHTHTRTCRHTHTHTHTRVHVHTYTHTHTHTYTHTHTRMSTADYTLQTVQTCVTTTPMFSTVTVQYCAGCPGNRSRPVSVCMCVWEGALFNGAAH